MNGLLEVFALLATALLCNGLDEKKYDIYRRFMDLPSSSVIIGAPSFPNHLPEAEPILPGHTLIRPGLGMLKSALKFPHRELEGGAGVYGNEDSLGIRYDGRNERVLYTEARRTIIPEDYPNTRKNPGIIIIIPNTKRYRRDTNSITLRNSSKADAVPLSADASGIVQALNAAVDTKDSPKNAVPLSADASSTTQVLNGEDNPQSEQTLSASPSSVNSSETGVVKKVKEKVKKVLNDVKKIKGNRHRTKSNSSSSSDDSSSSGSVEIFMRRPEFPPGYSEENQKLKKKKKNQMTISKKLPEWPNFMGHYRKNNNVLEKLMETLNRHIGRSKRRQESPSVLSAVPKPKGFFFQNIESPGLDNTDHINLMKSVEATFDVETQTAMPRKQELFWKTKDLFTHIKIDQHAPEYREFLPQNMDANELGNIRNWWFYNQADHKHIDD